MQMTTKTPGEGSSDLERVRSDIKTFVESGGADSTFEGYDQSQREAFEALDRAECIDPEKLRKPITL